MAITRSVNVTVKDSAGTVVEGARIQAVLNRADIDPVAGWIIPENTVEYSDSNGRAELDLWPNARGSKGSAYRVTATRKNGDLLFDVWAEIPDESPVFLADVSEPINCFGTLPSAIRDLSVSDETKRTIYVAMDGDNDNDGLTFETAVRTIERGIQRMSVLPAPAVVKVYPGDYYENGEMIVPEGCAVRSTSGQFTTNIIAKEGREQTNMLLLNSGCYIKGFTFRNQQLDSFDNPTKGFAVAFAPGARIRRSPYIRDCSQVSGFERENISAPLDPANGNPAVGKGGGVILADRAVLDPNSVYPYMLAFGATPRTPNGIGYCARNGAGINGISSITIFSRIAFYAIDGGHITLNNSGTQFGDFSMYAKGSMKAVRATEPAIEITVSTAAANTIDSNEQQLIDDMWAYLVDQGYVDGWDAEREEFTRRDAANLMRALKFDLESGKSQSTKSFAMGLFDYDAKPLAPASIQDAFVAAWEFFKDEFTSLMTDASVANALVDVVINTVTNPNIVEFGSLIESLGHQFNNAGAGTNKNALPVNFRRPGENLTVPFTIVEEDGGRVRWSGSDELNNQYLAGGTRINGLTGRIEGRPFNSSVRQISRRIANSRSNV